MRLALPGLKHKDAGVDIVIAQGGEGGGHTGEVGSIVLWPQVAKAIAPTPDAGRRRHRLRRADRRRPGPGRPGRVGRLAVAHGRGGRTCRRRSSSSCSTPRRATPCAAARSPASRAACSRRLDRGVGAARTPPTRCRCRCSTWSRATASPQPPLRRQGRRRRVQPGRPGGRPAREGGEDGGGGGARGPPPRAPGGRPARRAGVPAELSDSLAARGIAEPFPIQAATLPDALAGRDVCGRAPTGSGKTLAFGLADRRPQARSPSPAARGASCSCPPASWPPRSRRALQLARRRSGGKVLAIYGGTGYEHQRRALNKGVDVVVACPGRLEDLLANGDLTSTTSPSSCSTRPTAWPTWASSPRCAILDQTRPTARPCCSRPPSTATSTCSSALPARPGPPRRHRRRGARRRHPPLLDGRPRRPTRSRRRSSRSTADDRVLPHQARRRPRRPPARRPGSPPSRSTATAPRASASGRSPPSPTARATALVATDVAARGIHVDGVACVVHFDPPADDKDYVHRSGRTGRAGATGHVITLVIPEKRKDVAALRREPIEELPVTLDPPGGRPTWPSRDGLDGRGGAGRRDRRPRTDRARPRNAPERAPQARPQEPRPPRAHAPSGTVKFYDSPQGLRLHRRPAAARTCSCTSPRCRRRPSAASRSARRSTFDVEQGRQGHRGPPPAPRA